MFALLSLNRIIHTLSCISFDSVFDVYATGRSLRQPLTAEGVYIPLALWRGVGGEAIDACCVAERKRNANIALASLEERSKFALRQAVNLSQTGVAPRVRAVEDADIRTIVQDDVTRLRVNLLVACG